MTTERTEEREMEKLLKQVAEDATKIVWGVVTYPAAFAVEEMLKRRLLPLLEAGQAMQARLAVLSDEVGASEAVSSLAWDAALAGAKSEQEQPK